MCQDCQHDSNNSGFIFGLIIGAIIAAIVAIIIYKNDKSDILSTLQSKLTKFFQDVLDSRTENLVSKPKPAPKKKPVVLPEKILKSNILASSTTKPSTKPRTFIKPKKL